MTGEAASRAEIDAAAAYEELMVPALFGCWAPRVADAARIGRGDRVLDVACGTGVLAREVAGRVGADGHVVGLDPSAGMLSVARRQAPGVEWREGRAEALPFEDGAFDAVTSQFGLMFFDDQRRAVEEMVRVLDPGGRLAVAVWATLDENPAYAAEVHLLERAAGTRAADAVRAPFSLGDPSAVVALLEAAGVGAVALTTWTGEARFASPRLMVEADLRGWLPACGVSLPEARIEEILVAAGDALAPFTTDDGVAAFATRAHVVTGTPSADSLHGSLMENG